ncbi:MAG: DUF3015 family protein [Pseudobacteriovorax sp.]|nr:DUF3015 family protein [Pseudobacteriovorax sp.]
MKSYLACLLGVCLLFATSSYSADKSNGCGPGWYVLKKNSLLSSSGRAITNNILFPFSTLGMTFGTSNCAKHSLVKADKEALHFVENNLPLLRQDIALGEGQYLDAYLGVFGCQFPIGPEIKKELRAKTHKLIGIQDSMSFVTRSQGIINQVPGAGDWCHT